MNESATFAGSALLSPFYQSISTAGFVPLLVIVTGLRSLIALISVLLNLGLVWVTWHNRKLHGACNWLIAWESFSLAIYQIGIIVIFGVVLSGWNLIRLDLCFPLQWLPVFGKFFSLGMMAAIGLDRLKCILLPTWPADHFKRVYLLLLALICSICPIYILTISFVVMLRRPDIPVMCASSEISQHEALSTANTVALLLNLLSPAIYCLLGLVLLARRERIAASQDKTHRIYKSLLIILLIQLLGWGTNSGFQFFFSTLFSSQLLDDYQKWAINAVFSYGICLATAANAPALYFCSSEYKAAFQRQFGLIRSSVLPSRVGPCKGKIQVNRMEGQQRGQQRHSTTAQQSRQQTSSRMALPNVE